MLLFFETGDGIAKKTPVWSGDGRKYGEEWHGVGRDFLRLIGGRRRRSRLENWCSWWVGLRRWGWGRYWDRGGSSNGYGNFLLVLDFGVVIVVVVLLWLLLCHENTPSNTAQQKQPKTHEDHDDRQIPVGFCWSWVACYCHCLRNTRRAE
jgi:hypothetical protein